MRNAAENRDSSDGRAFTKPVGADEETKPNDPTNCQSPGCGRPKNAWRHTNASRRARSKIYHAFVSADAKPVGAKRCYCWKLPDPHDFESPGCVYVPKPVGREGSEKCACYHYNCTCTCHGLPYGSSFDHAAALDVALREASEMMAEARLQSQYAELYCAERNDLQRRLDEAVGLAVAIEDCPFDWGRAPEGLQQRLYAFLAANRKP